MRGGYTGRYLAAATLLLLLPTLVACGDSGRDGAIAWAPYEPTVAATPATPPPLAVGGMSKPPPLGSGPLTAEELQIYRPNELGVIPVLMYHVFVTDEAQMDQFTTTIDRFTSQLQWLYDHNFYVIPVESFVSDRITAPPGKHPVVLTFDDGSPGQFRLIPGADGTLVPDPLSAVGAMEAFFTAHPDFGRGGFFSVLPFNCFAMPAEPDQMPYCDQKLAWLAEHGYEVGNHTAGHQNLFDITDDAFAQEVGGAAVWVRDHVPTPANLGDVIAMPYGEYPDKEMHQEQRRMLREGFWLDGQEIRIRAAFMVGANPAESPSSTRWDPIFIPRIQTYDEVLDHWFTAFANGEVILYVSDGHPDTVVVPDPLPPRLDGELDPELIAAKGMQLVRYAP